MLLSETTRDIDPQLQGLIRSSFYRFSPPFCIQKDAKGTRVSIDFNSLVSPSKRILDALFHRSQV